jgi:hypothetical protein
VARVKLIGRGPPAGHIVIASAADWEAMHGDMGGYYEIRLTGPGRRQYRLFCILDNGSPWELRTRGAV